MALFRTCDGVNRREFLKAGAIGAAGFTLANYLRMAEAGTLAATAKAKAAIFVNLQGGPTHMDTFDLKPESPSEYRGEFSPIETNVPGIMISEHLPKLAMSMDKYAILRGVSHTLAAHDLGSEYVNTGNRPLPSIEFPGYGAIATKELPGANDLPNFVAIPNNRYQKTGFLGVQYAPMSTGAAPRPGQPFSVRGITLRNGVTLSDIEKRQTLLSDLDSTFRGVEKQNQLLEGLDKFSQQAYSILMSKRAREAFDVSKEDPSYAKLFGETPFGQSALLASRLVESGVRFVTISNGGWDTHNNNWEALKTRQLPPLDQALSGLLTGLEAKGLLESTVIFVTGEFGRTPKINTTRNGRDHYPRAMFMLLAGGGIAGGRVHGASDDKAMGPADKGYTPDEVAATFYHALGIDHTIEYATNTGRPIMVVRDGRVLNELFA
jgi:uncharacterized protein (DUF1501 family)